MTQVLFTVNKKNDQKSHLPIYSINSSIWLITASFQPKMVSGISFVTRVFRIGSYALLNPHCLAY